MNIHTKMNLMSATVMISVAASAGEITQETKTVTTGKEVKEITNFFRDDRRILQVIHVADKDKEGTILWQRVFQDDKVVLEFHIFRLANGGKSMRFFGGQKADAFVEFDETGKPKLLYVEKDGKITDVFKIKEYVLKPLENEEAKGLLETEGVDKDTGRPKGDKKSTRP